MTRDLKKLPRVSKSILHVICIAVLRTVREKTESCLQRDLQQWLHISKLKFHICTSPFLVNISINIKTIIPGFSWKRNLWICDSRSVSHCKESNGTFNLPAKFSKRVPRRCLKTKVSLVWHCNQNCNFTVKLISSLSLPPLTPVPLSWTQTTATSHGAWKIK